MAPARHSTNPVKYPGGSVRGLNMLEVGPVHKLNDKLYIFSWFKTMQSTLMASAHIYHNGESF